MTLSNNYAHAIINQEKTKPDNLRGVSIFVLIVNKLGPFEQPIYYLGLHLSLGFSNTRKPKKASGLLPLAFISFLVFGNPDETLALVYEILRRR